MLTILILIAIAAILTIIFVKLMSNLQDQEEMKLKEQLSAFHKNRRKTGYLNG